MTPPLLLLSILLLLSGPINAVPNAVRRADASSTVPTPTAWESIADDGTLSTVTPVVSTDRSGNPTTVDAKPTATGTTAIDDDDVFARCDSSKYELSETGNKQPFVPFCAPHNGTKWWVGGNYYVTWNPGHWAKNSSVRIVLNYNDAGEGGKVAKTWESANSFGFINVEPSGNWLVNQTARGEGEETKMDNQTMHFTIADDSPNSLANIQRGPTIILVSKPTPDPVDTSTSNRAPVSFLGLTVGLPIVFVFVVGTVLSLHFCMKNRRTVGPISIGGGRRHLSNKGYSGRAMRRQKAAAAANRGAEYRDELEGEVSPAGGMPHRPDEWELTSVKGGR